MSWHYLQEQEEASWAGNSLDGAPDALLRLMPTPEASSSPGSETASLNPSPSGMTLRRSTDDHGEEVLMWFLGDSPVRTYLAPERERDSVVVDPACGPNLPGSLAKYSPDTYSWRTRQCSLLEGLESYSETWPRWGIMRHGEFWARTMPELRIDASASGLFPTPTAIDATMKASGKQGTKGRHAVQLSHLANGGWINNPNWATERTWPTMTKQEAITNHGYQHSGNKDYPTLTGAVGAAPQRGGTKTPQTWPTPTAVTDTGGAAMCKWGGSGARAKLRKTHPKEMNGALNPTWVEWLMGWPIGWTDLKPLEMDRFQQWRDSHGKC